MPVNVPKHWYSKGLGLPIQLIWLSPNKQGPIL